MTASISGCGPNKTLSVFFSTEVSKAITEDNFIVLFRTDEIILKVPTLDDHGSRNVTYHIKQYGSVEEGEMKGQSYQYLRIVNYGRIRIYRPDGIWIEEDERKLYFEMERRWGIARATAFEINDASLRTLYKIALEMQQYVEFQEIT
jgi:hypothetical protein